jgi:hypothetical protein
VNVGFVEREIVVAAVPNNNCNRYGNKVSDDPIAIQDPIVVTRESTYRQLPFQLLSRLRDTEVVKGEDKLII